MPTGFAGRETSHNSGPFYEKILKVFYRGGVHAATNYILLNLSRNKESKRKSKQ
jgi:hypothetical protein